MSKKLSYHRVRHRGCDDGIAGAKKTRKRGGKVECEEVKKGEK